MGKTPPPHSLHDFTDSQRPEECSTQIFNVGVDLKPQSYFITKPKEIHRILLEDNEVYY